MIANMPLHSVRAGDSTPSHHLGQSVGSADLQQWMSEELTCYGSAA